MEKEIGSIEKDKFADIIAVSGNPTVDVTEKDFKIEIPSTIPTGNVTFVIHSDGPTLHEFNVARTDLANLTSLRASDDSLNDAPDTPNPHFIHDPAWEIEGIDIGMTKRLTVPIDHLDTSKGWHYVFYCNMDGHFMAGMIAQAVAQ